jgi:ABC-2 type transport system ATP-binding protein
MSIAVATQNLSKTYKTGFWRARSLHALKNLDLEVRSNEIFGYLGPNGAGKSTTFKLLMSLIYPTSGKAEVLGRSVYDLNARYQIGYLPENPYFYEHLSAEEFLSFYASFFGYSRVATKGRIDYLLRLTDISHARKLQLRKFSKGMLQRVGIAQALINDPSVVFLDEPMSGLDPMGRREVRDLILSLKREGKTVFFSTHILSDVETLCDRVAVLNRGKLVGSGHLSDLISQEVTRTEIVIAHLEVGTLRRLLGPEVTINQSGTTLRLEIEAVSPLAPIIEQIEQASAKIVSISPVRQTMEDYFLKVVNGNGSQEDKSSRHIET